MPVVKRKEEGSALAPYRILDLTEEGCMISGKVLVQKGKKDVTVLEKGECFGEMAYLTGEARSASIITKDDCILLRFSSTLLDRLSESIQVLFYKNFTQTILRRLA